MDPFLSDRHARWHPVDLSLFSVFALSEPRFKEEKKSGRVYFLFLTCLLELLSKEKKMELREDQEEDLPRETS